MPSIKSMRRCRNGRPGTSTEHVKFNNQASLMPVLVLASSATKASTLPDAANTFLSTPVLDQLVSRVKEEVSRKLQPLLVNLGSLSQPVQSSNFYQLRLNHSLYLLCLQYQCSPLSCSPLGPPFSPLRTWHHRSRMQWRYQLYTTGSNQF